MTEHNFLERISGLNNDAPGCQLKSIYESKKETFTKLNFFDRVRLFLLQQRCEMQGRIDKRLGFLKSKKTIDEKIEGSDHVSGSKGGNENLKAGDLVKVLPIKEIEKTLDLNQKTNGLWFMPGMKSYCGMKAKVLRKVDYIFDERAWGMVKCSSNVYLLEKALCTGEGMFEKEGCDRCCFFFWHGTWLRKL